MARRLLGSVSFPVPSTLRKVHSKSSTLAKGQAHTPSGWPLCRPPRFSLLLLGSLPFCGWVASGVCLAGVHGHRLPRPGCARLPGVAGQAGSRVLRHRHPLVCRRGGFTRHWQPAGEPLDAQCLAGVCECPRGPTRRRALLCLLVPTC